MPFAVPGTLDGDAGSENQSQGYFRAKEALMRQVLQRERTGWSRVSQQGTEGPSNPDGWECFVQAGLHAAFGALNISSHVYQPSVFYSLLNTTCPTF